MSFCIIIVSLNWTFPCVYLMCLLAYALTRPHLPQSQYLQHVHTCPQLLESRGKYGRQYCNYLYSDILKFFLIGILLASIELDAHAKTFLKNHVLT